MYKTIAMTKSAAMIDQKDAERRQVIEKEWSSLGFTPGSFSYKKTAVLFDYSNYKVPNNVQNKINDINTGQKGFLDLSSLGLTNGELMKILESVNSEKLKALQGLDLRRNQLTQFSNCVFARVSTRLGRNTWLRQYLDHLGVPQTCMVRS